MQCLVGTCQQVSAGCDGCFYFEVLSSGLEKNGSTPVCGGGGGGIATQLGCTCIYMQVKCWKLGLQWGRDLGGGGERGGRRE